MSRLEGPNEENKMQDAPMRDDVDSLFADPVMLEIIWGRLQTIAAEMQSVLRRVAFSTLISAANDLGCEIMDSRGWSVAHAATSNPTFNLTLPNVAAAMLERFSVETLVEGDVLMTNDPWIGAGHLSDVAIVTPLFVAGKVVGFAGSIAHVSDIGGLLDQTKAGSIYEEGVFFPPLKLYDAGVANAGVFDTLRASVRAPEMVIGDINAIVAANSVATGRVRELLDGYGLHDMLGLSDAVQTRAERAMRERILRLPDGAYDYEHIFDSPTGPMTFGATLTIANDTLEVDFHSVPRQVEPGGINSTLSFTTARTTYALNCLLTPDIPSNQGLFRPITVTAPEGSILNPVLPASVNDRTKTGWQTAAVVQGALAQVLDDVPAQTAFQASPRFIGTDGSGAPVSTIYMHGGGLGASKHGDGADGVCFPTSSNTIPVEIFESATNVYVRSNELRRDSAGAGRMRGGHGVNVRLDPPRNEAVELTITTDINQVDFPPRGLEGGLDGLGAFLDLDGEALSSGDIGDALGAMRFDARARSVGIHTAGGGGHGDPGERPVSAVVRDVRDGLLSVEKARVDYGVAVDVDRMTGERVRLDDDV